MLLNVLSENILPILALAPAADRYDTNPASDVISMKNYQRVSFLLSEGAGGTGTVKLTVEACDDFTPSNTVEMKFKYRVASNSGTLTDQFGALTAQDTPATGYTTVAGANKMIEVIVDARDLPEGYDKVRLKLTEVVNSPCAASVNAFAYQPRIRKSVMPTAIA